MSKIKNGGLDQYDKMYGLNGIGGERVKLVQQSFRIWQGISASSSFLATPQTAMYTHIQSILRNFSKYTYGEQVTDIHPPMNMIPTALH